MVTSSASIYPQGDKMGTPFKEDSRDAEMTLAQGTVRSCTWLLNLISIFWGSYSSEHQVAIGSLSNPPATDRTICCLFPESESFLMTAALLFMKDSMFQIFCCFHEPLENLQSIFFFFGVAGQWTYFRHLTCAVMVDLTPLISIWTATSGTAKNEKLIPLAGALGHSVWQVGK